MKRRFKRLNQKILTIGMLFVTLFNICIPVNLFAEDNFTLTFQINSGTHTLEANNSEIGIDGNFVSFRTSDDKPIDAQVVCSNNSCSLTTNVAGSLIYNGQNGNFTLYVGGKPYRGDTISSSTVIMIENYEEEQGGFEPGAEHGENFDGKATLLWACSDGSLCYHSFDNLLTERAFETIYVNAKDVKDERTNEEFIINATSTGFVLQNDFEAFVNDYKRINQVDEVPWAQINADEVIRHIDKGEIERDLIDKGICSSNVDEETLHACVDSWVNENISLNFNVLNPLEAPKSENSYSHFGDRNFKITIYNDNYLGISLGNTEDLTYIPDFWDIAQMPDSIDVSTSTIMDPKIMETILLEDTLRLTPKTFGETKITNIEVEGIREDAVSIVKDGNDYVINFKSNFYDQVLLKITDSNNNTHYLKIVRIVNKIVDNFAPNNDKPALITTVYYDEGKTRDDFTVMATLVYSDGTNAMVNATALNEAFEHYGNPVTFDYNAGKHLKASQWKVDLDMTNKEIVGVYFNIINNNEVESVYAGTYMGSGLGLYWDIDNRSVDYER